MTADRLTILHVYPRQMGVSGDRGNVAALVRRAAAADIETQVLEYAPGDDLPTTADVVVIGGPLWALLTGAGAALERAIAASTATATVRGIRLLGSTLGTDVAAVGAACLVLDSALTARPTDLMIASH